MTKLDKEGVEMIGDGVLPVASVSGLVHFDGVNKVAQWPVVHNRKNGSGVVDEVHFGKCSRKLKSIVLPVVQLKRNGFLIHIGRC